jgi:hypothetical protein
MVSALDLEFLPDGHHFVGEGELDRLETEHRPDSGVTQDECARGAAIWALDRQDRRGMVRA